MAAADAVAAVAVVAVAVPAVVGDTKAWLAP